MINKTLPFTVLVIIVFSPIRILLESSILSHALIEYPLYISIGLILGKQLSYSTQKRLNQYNAGGIAGILIAGFNLAFWMIPQWMDASINNLTIASAKALSLSLFVGLPLFLSWGRLHVISKGVVKIEFLTMLFRLGWIYKISPDRLCNNYLLNEQAMLGQAFIILGIALSITWLLQVFFWPNMQSQTTQETR